MSNEMLFGGFVSDDTSSSSSALKFGLNQKVKLTKFEYNPAIEFKSGDTGEGIEAEIDVNGMILKMNIYPTTKVYFKNEEITNPQHPEFRKGVTLLKKRIFHIAKCFASEAALIEAVAIPKTFGDFVNSIIDTFEDGWQEKELDLFLQYQWQLKEGAERKYLEIPKKTSQGPFLIPHVNSVFSEVRVNDGKVTVGGELIENFDVKLPKKDTALAYLDFKNEFHPFHRGEWFMENGWGQADDGAEDNLSGW